MRLGESQLEGGVERSEVTAADLQFVTLHVTSHIPVGPFSDPNEAVLDFDADVMMLDPNGEEDDDGKKVGTIRWSVVDPEVMHENGFSVADALDDHSQELTECVSLLGRDGGLSDAVVSQFDCLCTRLLLISRLEIAEPYRRHRLGLLVIHRIIKMFGKGAFVVLKPFPFDDGNRLSPAALKQGVKKLEAYYAALGFRRIHGKKLMGCAADETMREPELV